MTLNNESHFLTLTLYSLDVFKTKTIGLMKALVQCQRCQIKQWLHADDHSTFQPPPNGRKPVVSIEARMMKCMMFNRNNKVNLLEILWR